MRLLHKIDDEMLKTIQLSVHTNSKEKMKEYFKQKIKDKPADPDTWFYHAVCSWELMGNTNPTQEKYKLFIEVLKACERACLLQAHHWPALFLRSMVRSLMNSNELDEMAFYLISTDYTEEDAERDRLKMIELQKQTESQSYFFIPYAGLAKQALEKDNIIKAESLIHEGLADTSVDEIKYFRRLLSIPMLILYRKLMMMKQTQLAGLIRERYNQLFPSLMIKAH